MPDKFKGSGSITLYPGDISVPIAMRFPPASASTMNDGAIPYGSTIISASALVYYLDDDSAGSTKLMSTAASFDGAGTVTVFLTHDATVDKGLHSIVTTVVFDLAGVARNMTRPFDLDRVWVK